jgi:hypothetical protein
LFGGVIEMTKEEKNIRYSVFELESIIYESKNIIRIAQNTISLSESKLEELDKQLNNIKIKQLTN